MLRSAASRLSCRTTVAPRRLFSSSSDGPLAADSGALATHGHHTMNLALAVLAPIYFITPESYSDGFFGKTFGILLSANITAHSWIGLNYVATDYVPKVSKALLGPARMAIAGMSFVTFLGLSRIAVGSPGGIKGCVKGLWNPKKHT
jgi:succinate dehydrogenase hydrophobic anchor subunit